MQIQSKIDVFWKKYLQTLPTTERNSKYFDIFSFGDTSEMADEILPAVLDGTKTTTSMLLWDLEAQKRQLWHVGDFSIVMDGKQNSVCVIKTTELEVKPFNKISE